jgi:hypothetical protein
MLVSARGAIRLFFVITPFVCFSSSFFIRKIFTYRKKSRDELMKFFFLLLIILALVGAIFSFGSFYASTNNQAKNTGPSAGLQWQKAMSWVRDNTPEGSIFVHWWDYGHWVTYLGERPVVTDGGHAVGYWDHLIGRYLLTTPDPKTAFSFMKSHDVSYLLIDPTDIGKYGAYSKIGSGQEGIDRYSWIPTMVSSPEQIQETKDGEIRIYQGGTPLDQDIIYNLDGREIFLPENLAAIGGFILETKRSSSGISINQPQGAFIYNQEQITLPLRYLYFNGELTDFGSGVESTVVLVQRIYQNQQGTQLDLLGAAMYLSPKVSNSLFAQLYLMNDPSNQYESITLAHAETDPNIATIRSQGAEVDEFVYFGRILGPIKIWEVGYPSNVLEREEFLSHSGDFGELDNLQFTK